MFASLLRLRPFIAPYRLRLLFGVAAFGLARFCEGLVPFFLAAGIDRIAAGQWDVTQPVLGMALAVAGRYVVVTAARYSVRSAGLKVAFDLRQKLYASLQGQGARFFARHSVGDMMTRAVADVALIQRLIAMGAILVIILVYATLVGFGFMLYFSPTLTLLLVPPLPLVWYYARRAAREMGAASLAVQERLSDLATFTEENLSGIRTIQAMAQEDRAIARFQESNLAYGRAFYQQSVVNSRMMAIMPSLAALCSVTILGYGGHLVLAGEMTAGAFVAFFMYVGMVVQPFRVAGFIVNLAQRAAVASDRLFEVFDRPPEVPDRPSGRTPADIRGSFVIRDLRYRHAPDRPLLFNGLALTVEAGEMVTIMGPVGAGKTTLLHLLVRLFDPPGGHILLDDHDVRDYPLRQLRASIALAPQDAFLFAEAVGANLSYDDPGRPEARIWSAADAADLQDAIVAFPHSLDTLIGERGVTLSGGERQRATLARALIREAPVLLLDDCFASVDTSTEERILQRLKALRAGKTTLLVSHRVSTARHADRILILHRGRVRESGPHEALLRQGGSYAELAELQRGAENNAHQVTAK